MLRFVLSKFLIFFSFIVLLSSCSFKDDDTGIKTELYLGLYDGVLKQEISLIQLDTFIKETVASVFPSGFTVLESCKGAWFSENNGLTQEKCAVLILSYPKSQKQEADQGIIKIIEAYKTQFHQETVLKIQQPIIWKLL